MSPTSSGLIAQKAPRPNKRNDSQFQCATKSRVVVNISNRCKPIKQQQEVIKQPYICCSIPRVFFLLNYYICIYSHTYLLTPI